MTSAAGRPWWKKWRWRLAAAYCLSLPVLYPLSGGPLGYAERRGWISTATVETLYSPLFPLYDRYPALARVQLPYHRWWHERAVEHGGRRHDQTRASHPDRKRHVGEAEGP